MPGRFALVTTNEQLKSQYGLEEISDLYPRYNIAPSQDILFLCIPDDSNIKPLFLHWGLIPFWAKDKKIGNTLINARSETAADKPVFRSSFKSKRGIIIMSGFFEWKEDAQRLLPQNKMLPKALFVAS